MCKDRCISGVSVFHIIRDFRMITLLLGITKYLNFMQYLIVIVHDLFLKKNKIPKMIVILHDYIIMDK